MKKYSNNQIVIRNTKYSLRHKWFDSTICRRLDESSQYLAAFIGTQVSQPCTG